MFSTKCFLLFPRAFVLTKCKTFGSYVHLSNHFDFIENFRLFLSSQHFRLLTYYTKTHEYIKCEDEEKEIENNKKCDDTLKKKESSAEITHNELRGKLTQRKKYRVGISKYGTEKLGEIVYVDIMYKINELVEKGECIATIESVKSVGDVYAPISGVITDVNTKIMEEVNFINKDPENEGWIIEIETDNVDEKEILNSEEYKRLREEEERLEELRAQQSETFHTDVQGKETIQNTTEKQ